MLSHAKFIFSKSKVIEEYNKLEKISDYIAYSVKSNPYLTYILEDNTESNFLTHHINELIFIKDRSKVWFMLHSPEDEELEVLFKNKVNKFIVDNNNDLERLLYFLDNSVPKEEKITLLLRMRLKEYTIQTGKYFVYGFFSKEINEQVNKLKTNPRIEGIGVHVHRKTQNLSEWALVNELSDSLSKETLNTIKYLDIGGGIPVPYKNISVSVIDRVHKEIKELKDFSNKNNIKLIIEPGRAIAAPSGKLVTTIKNIVDNVVFVDASLFNSSMDTLVTNIKLLVDGEIEETDTEDEKIQEKGDGIAYTIKGLTPASEDIFRYRVYFKKGREPKIGNKLIFLNAGAYIYYTDLFNLERPEIEFEE